jgi:hypothetical protein
MDTIIIWHVFAEYRRMSYIPALSALVTLIIFLQIGALKVKYFHLGIYTDLSIVRLWKIKKALKKVNNAEDIRLLKKLRSWQIAAIISLGVTIVSILVVIAHAIRG